MTPSELERYLAANFELLCFVDLADINHSHSAVYRLFTEHYREQYTPNQRLVLYSQHRPSDKLLSHIVDAAAVIDVSNFFILICCPHDISSSLTMSDPIGFLQINVESKELMPDVIHDTTTICPMPWMNLSIKDNDYARVCCVASERIPVEDDVPLKDMFFNDYMDNLRQQFLQGQRPTACTNCWRLEEHGNTSHRQRHLQFYKKNFFSDWIDNPRLRSFDLKISSVCNFKCRICNPVDSSLILQEQLKIETDPQRLILLKQLSEYNKWYDNNPEFVQQLIELLPDIVNIDFYGGEPFLLKQLPVFLKAAVDSGHAHRIRLHFNTNGSVYPANLIPLLEQFKQVDIGISIDDIGHRFEFERGGRWSDVEANYRQFRLLPDQFNISIMPVVNVQNVYYLDELLAWADSLNGSVVINVLSHPNCMSIDSMTPLAKRIVVEKYQNNTNPMLQQIAKRVANSPGSDGQEFRNYMMTLDQTRKQNFAESHSEIAFAMGYIVQ